MVMESVRQASLFKLLGERYLRGRSEYEVRRIVYPLTPDGILAPNGHIRSIFVPIIARELSVASKQIVDPAELTKALEEHNLTDRTPNGECNPCAEIIYQRMIRERDEYLRMQILLNHVHRFGYDPNVNRQIATRCLADTFLFRTTQVFTVDPKNETWLHRYSIGVSRSTSYATPSVPPERSVDDFITRLIRSEIPSERITSETNLKLYEYNKYEEWGSLHIPDIERFKRFLSGDKQAPPSENPEEVLHLIFGRPEDTYINVYAAYQQQTTPSLALNREKLQMLVESFASFLSPARKLEYAHQQLQILSVTDALTNLFNRKMFFSKIGEEFVRCSRHHHKLSLIIFDIDNFKRINDTYGHPVGDFVIKRIADIALGNTRPYDLIARYGGEEYVIMLPETNENNAHVVAKRLRLAVEEHKFIYDALPAIPVTISLGVITHDPDSDNPLKDVKQMVANADGALLQAKREGKNRVVIAHSPYTE